MIFPQEYWRWHPKLIVRAGPSTLTSKPANIHLCYIVCSWGHSWPLLAAWGWRRGHFSHSCGPVPFSPAKGCSHSRMAVCLLASAAAQAPAFTHSVVCDPPFLFWEGRALIKSGTLIKPLVKFLPKQGHLADLSTIHK